MVHMPLSTYPDRTDNDLKQNSVKHAYNLVDRIGLQVKLHAIKRFFDAQLYQTRDMCFSLFPAGLNICLTPLYIVQRLILACFECNQCNDLQVTYLYQYYIMVFNWYNVVF